MYHLNFSWSIWCSFDGCWLFQSFMTWNGFFTVHFHFIAALFFWFGGVVFFVFFCAAIYSRVTAALSITGSDVSVVAVVVSVVILQLMYLLQWCLLNQLSIWIHYRCYRQMQEKAIALDITKNFVFIFFKI